jgi:hypothetical protein
MKTIIITLIALALAIPTYGISLIVWVIIKYKMDSFIAKRAIINSIISSCDAGGENKSLHSINNNAVRLVFKLFNGEILTRIGKSVSGVVPHPVSGALMHATITQMSNNVLQIKAEYYEG